MANLNDSPRVRDDDCETLGTDDGARYSIYEMK
jgi:hypothetical protein